MDEEDAKRRERAARFGTEFNAVDHSGLKEQGVSEIDGVKQSSCSASTALSLRHSKRDAVR